MEGSIRFGRRKWHLKFVYVNLGLRNFRLYQMMDRWLHAVTVLEVLREVRKEKEWDPWGPHNRVVELTVEEARCDLEVVEIEEWTGRASRTLGRRSQGL